MQPPLLSDGAVTSDPRITNRKRGSSSSPQSSCMSMKSDGSMMQPPLLSDGAVTSDPRITNRKRGSSSSPQSSCMSMKSDGSMMQPPLLSDGTVTSDPSSLRLLSRQNSCQTQNKTEPDLLDETKELQRVKNQHKTSMKNKDNQVGLQWREQTNTRTKKILLLSHYGFKHGTCSSCFI
ncbi:hypothetical protein Q8A67_025060 [Cirrhinus molitorella]|uniref:Uncharacterized protein n=1 Tax=Cirrhinus molitorella TaxID=172907 RepID=A0AA88P7M7_9TELE|nr:hypothetical protein Q8A67_025060 [Cirrhinus molitorella]